MCVLHIFLLILTSVYPAKPSSGGTIHICVDTDKPVCSFLWDQSICFRYKKSFPFDKFGPQGTHIHVPFLFVRFITYLTWYILDLIGDYCRKQDAWHEKPSQIKCEQWFFKMIDTFHNSFCVQIITNSQTLQLVTRHLKQTDASIYMKNAVWMYSFYSATLPSDWPLRVSMWSCAEVPEYVWAATHRNSTSVVLRYSICKHTQHRIR